MNKIVPKAKHNAKPKKKLKLNIEVYSFNTKEGSLPKKEKQEQNRNGMNRKQIRKWQT